MTTRLLAFAAVIVGLISLINTQNVADEVITTHSTEEPDHLDKDEKSRKHDDVVLFEAYSLGNKIIFFVSAGVTLGVLLVASFFIGISDIYLNAKENAVKTHA
uniref:Col_cuticle_N domain-containing protein n=1 Tax=Heterorhabditis bacteriophora TaxID=37862 RepID=A0A1I7XPP3_HETBA